MSAQGTINVVDDEEMSSEGSVNTPVLPQWHAALAENPTQQIPSRPLIWTSQERDAATQQSGVASPSGSAAPTIPVQSTEVLAATTIPVDAPSRAETRQAFDEVSSALHSVSSAHEEVKAGMQTLASGVEDLHRARAGDVETTAQIQRTLQRTLSASGDLEMRVGQAEQSQAQARAAAEEARMASERALQRAAQLQMEQEKTSQQVTQTLVSQAERTQKQIQDATQVAMKTQGEVQGVSALARSAKEIAQQAAANTSKYEKELADVMHQMKQLENLLIEQRQKSSSLEHQLSAAQDRIGGAERKARLLDEENVMIKSELKFWNDVYAQDTGVSHTGSEPVTVNSPPITMPVPVPPAPSAIPVTEAQNPVMSNPFVSFGDMTTPTVPPPWMEPINAAQTTSNLNVGPWDEFPPVAQTSTRRESFGSVFPGSSGTQGNGNGGTSPRRRNAPASSSTFNIGIKPKDPPYFNGRANEDVDTWLAKVGDFLYLTEANNRQQVAYTATLLQEAAADWWMSLLKERHGVRPVDFPELAGLLQKRFGSSTRVDRARADLRNIRQAQAETVRSYSTRFEALLAKLPSFDAEWAKTQFIWGLHQRVAELVVIAKPGDLAAAINQAEHIEMARNFASGNIPSQKTGTPFRGRGGFMRGRGRFNAVQAAGPSNQTTMQGTPSFAAQQQYSSTQRPVKPNQCIRCKGYGHWASECPSYRQGTRGGRGYTTRGRFGRGRRGGQPMQRGRGRNQNNNQSVNASLVASGPGAPAPQPQVQVAAPVPEPPRPGN